MKTIVSLLLVLGCYTSIQAQSIVGSWQLVKQSSCLDDDIEVNDDGMEDVLGDMKSMGKATPQVLRLKDNNTGDESTKIISRKKSYNSNSFLYKFNGTTLHFLDKRSKTIIESFTVEKFEADSLIISNAARACETRIFVRLK